MGRTDAVYQKHSLYIHAALIATHANHPKGFRQKDVKFYIELLSNWMETSFTDYCLTIQNTQVQRFLKALSAEGLLREEMLKGRPTYQFRPIGLVEVTTRMVSDDSLDDLHNFYFLYHMVSLYSEKMEQMLFGDRNDLPKSYQLEIKHLLDKNSLVERQSRRIRNQIAKLKERISEAYKMSEIAGEMLKKGRPLADIIARIEALYPYQLNNQKKLSELFKSLSPDVQFLEITEAPKLRAQTLWEPLLRDYQSYLNNISELK